MDCKKANKIQAHLVEFVQEKLLAEMEEELFQKKPRYSEEEAGKALTHISQCACELCKKGVKKRASVIDMLICRDLLMFFRE